MSEIIPDIVEPTMKIGGDEWLFTEVKVELSLNDTPNYVDIVKMTPDTEAGTSFKNPTDLIGEKFSLSVDNSLISNRDTEASEKTLLFKGNLANISSIGTNVYEGIAYDPSQQALNEQKKGNVLNQRVRIQNPYKKYESDLLPDNPTAYTSAVGRDPLSDNAVVTKASKALEQLINQSPIEETDIQLQPAGKQVSGPRGTFVGAKDIPVRFDNSYRQIGGGSGRDSILGKLTKETKSTWWFDREGVFHFGVPEPTIHSPQLITNTSAGLTTPPYQSVKVIGSDVATQEGYANGLKNPDEPIVKGADVTLNSDGDPEATVKDFAFGEKDDLTEPTFVYKNQEIISDEQAENTVKNIAKDLAKQYASGKVTVVGFPEVSVFDVIIMPHAEKSNQSVGNYSPRQPMGGGVFGVYKVVHKLNPSDGFITDIHTAGMSGPASVLVEEESIVNAPGGQIEDGRDSDGGSGTNSDSDVFPNSPGTKGWGLTKSS